MSRRRAVCFVLFLLLRLRPAYGESPACHAVYRDGGAPAVLNSPRCPRWYLLSPSAAGTTGDGSAHDAFPPPWTDCDLAVGIGRRRSQEDRAVCALGIRIPFLERTRVKEIDVGIVAVFDGHNGAEASDMASKLLLEYFLLHVYFLLDVIYSVFLQRDSEGRLINAENIIQEVLILNEAGYFLYSDRSISPALFDSYLFKEILKESLLRTIRDVDLTFSMEALNKNLEAGSTATVVLLVDGQILVANVGDSKAFICTKDFATKNYKKGKSSALHGRHRASSRQQKDLSFDLSFYDGPAYHVNELTTDHHPDREDEKHRVEGAGGYVAEWAGIPRVNGELALSRAIGDMPYKRYGVISVPDLTGWHILSKNDSFLVAISDGAIEKMTMQDICNLLLYEELIVTDNQQSYHLSANKLASVILQSAIERGTVDNVAAVVVPLQDDKIAVQGGSYFGDTRDSLHFGLQSVRYQTDQAWKSTAGSSTSVVEMEHYNHMSSKFRQFLVQAKPENLGCFYLSENLNEDVDYIFLAPLNLNVEEMHEIYKPVTETGTLGIYKDHNFCWYFGFQEYDKDQCTSFDSFSEYFGLLDSSPHNASKKNSSTSFRYKTPDFRYKLKKRFDRGSYGEVWMAFRWNCTQADESTKDFSYFSNSADLESSNCSRASFSGETSFVDSGDWDIYILKRIMVERGNAAYLSGLREKYFGELFSNATKKLGGFGAAEFLMSFPEDSHHSPDQRGKNSSIGDVGLMHIARFVESFETNSNEIWLVFQNEGISLSKLIYSAEERKIHSGDETDERVRYIQMLQPSAWWYWLRTTKAGQSQLRNLVWQLLMALKFCHDRNITHRDIKPENMIVCFQDAKTGKCLREIPTDQLEFEVNMRVIDFGSAIDDFTMKHLYGSGPTRSEQTFEYTPPEALLNATWFQGSKSSRLKYDIWSVGVVMLELILGSPHVFQISDRSRALLDQHLDGWGDQAKELAYKLKSYMELCILVPGATSNHHSSSTLGNGNFMLASWKCSEESFSYQVKSRDPLKLGFPDIWALRLVRQLLVWHPEDRLSVDEALEHPYFHQ